MGKEFQVGDEVKYSGKGAPDGKIGLIKYKDSKDNYAIAFDNHDGHNCDGHCDGNGYWCDGNELELIESLKKSNKEFQVGDKVKIIKRLEQNYSGDGESLGSGIVREIEENYSTAFHSDKYKGQDLYCVWVEKATGYLGRFVADELELIKSSDYFEVGKRVEIIEGHDKGVTGTISSINDNYIYCKDWSDLIGTDREGRELNIIKSKLKLINDEGNEITSSQSRTESKFKTMIQSIPRTLKRVLSSSLTKQYRAGLINGNLELTEAGEVEMKDILSQEKIVQEGLTKAAERIIKAENRKSKIEDED